MPSEENLAEEVVVVPDREIEALGRLLRAELVAAVVYRRVTRVIHDGDLLPMLLENSQSHQERVQLLRDLVFANGGTPEDHPGAGRGYADQIAAAASMGPKAVLVALVQLENQCLRLYRRDLERLEVRTRFVVERALLPAQWLSGDTISALLNFVH